MSILTFHVVRYCAEECAWQQSGEVSVADMVDAWGYAHRHRHQPVKLRDVLALGRIVEPRKNAQGLRKVGRFVIITRTHTKTFALLNAWASTTPADYGSMPRPGSPCAVPSCGQPLKAHEVVDAVTETGGPDAPEPIPCSSDPSLTTAECHHAEQWVCWRHIRPDDGPITTA